MEYPQHVAEYGTYEEAQGAVDYLADQKFAVQNLLIVGTNLKLIERVTGRRSWGTVLGQGAISGITTGMLVGFMLMLFSEGGMNMLFVGLGLGIVFGMIASGLGYAVSGGKRDFNSARQTVATSYEVLAEHKVAAQARELLSQRPGARAALFE
nr:general stress protein [Tessaracoccus bendigoensis]